ADVIDASALVEGPITDRLRASIAFRKSYLNSTLSAFTSKDVSEFVPIPDYLDGQVKVVGVLGPNETLEAFGLASHDTIPRTVTSEDPTEVKRETTGFGFHRVILRYQKQTGDGASIFVSPWMGRDQESTDQRFGTTPTALARTSNVFGARLGWRGRLAKSAT